MDDCEPEPRHLGVATGDQVTMLCATNMLQDSQILQTEFLNGWPFKSNEYSCGNDV